MAKLDIIVTHHEESVPEIEQFFMMLKCQQGVDFNDIAVTFVNTSTYQPAISYHAVNIIPVPGKNTPEARNIGLKNTSSPWVMFCDCDDLFADVCTLSSFLDNLPTNDCDVIWSRTIIQSKRGKDEFIFAPVDDMDFTTTNGKIYRRETLEANGITFCTVSTYDYEYIFNSIVLSVVPPHRIAKLTTDFYTYFKKYRENGLRHSKTYYRETANDVRKYTFLAGTFSGDSPYDAGCFMARALFRAYYELEERGDGLPPFPDPASIDWLKQYMDMDMIRTEYNTVQPCDRDPIQEEVLAEVMNMVQNVYNELGIELYFKNENISFDEWFDKTFGNAHEPWTPMYNVKPIEPPGQPKIVVYSGTRNVYQNMVTAMKSLLCHTPVDKVYFLIEDDVFPFMLPSCVECINVTALKQCFPEDSPNFRNPWTWMCLTRALYPDLFNMTDKILSLDIDTVVQDDISDLWDIDLTDYYLAGVQEPQRKKKSTDPMYINFGVVMMNLKKMREDSIKVKVVDLLNRTKLDCPEQTAFNRICADHIYELPADYNHTAFSHITGESQNPRVVHYAGQKFWRHYSLPSKYEKMSINEVSKKQMMFHADNMKEGE